MYFTTVMPFIGKTVNACPSYYHAMMNFLNWGLFLVGIWMNIMDTTKGSIVKKNLSPDPIKTKEDLIGLYQSISQKEATAFVAELVAGYHHMDLAKPSRHSSSCTPKES